LISLGISDLNAIRVAAIANNAPVSYGALGAPIIALAAVTGYPLLALSGSVGTVVAVLALLPPWVLLYLVSGREGMKGGWPLAVGGCVGFYRGQGGNERRLAARRGRLARLYRRPVSGCRAPGAVSARCHRRHRLLHRAARAAQSLAAEDRAGLRRCTGQRGGGDADARTRPEVRRGAAGLDAVRSAADRGGGLDGPVVAPAAGELVQGHGDRLLLARDQLPGQGQRDRRVQFRPLYRRQRHY